VTCEELSPDYTSYALGVAEEPERGEIADHLARHCPACLSGVTSAMGTVAAVSGAVQLSPPPKGVARRVTASVERSPRRSLILTLAPWAITLAMSIALLSIGISGRHESGAAPRLEQAIFMLNDPATRDMKFGEAAKPPMGRVFVNAAKGFVLIAAGLPHLDSSKRFALWVVPENGNPISAGTFESESDGTAVVVRTGPVVNAVEIEATVEPAAGSTQPTTSPILVTKF
jgi:hypothetical protein